MRAWCYYSAGQRGYKVRLIYQALSVLVIAVLAAQSVPPSIFASPSASPWLSPQDPTLQSVYDLAPAEAPPTKSGGMTCVDGKIITRPKIGSQTEISGTSCLKTLPYGMISTSGYFVIPGNNLAGPVTPFSGTAGMVPVPNSSTMMMLVGGQFLQIYNNFLAALTPHVAGDGSVSYNVNRPADALLKDKSSNQLGVNYNTIAFSNNGQWMVIDAPTKAMLRVNLSTFEVLPFRAPFVYGSGFDPNAQYGISDDGNTAFVSGSGTFEVYDLATCGAVPNTITGPVSCQFKNLYSFIGSHISNLLSNPVNLRFAGDDFITLYASHGSPRVVTKYSLSTSGTVVSLGGYLALGDSYSSGQGDDSDSYMTGTDTDKNGCHLSPNSYSFLIQKRLNIPIFHSVACSGAVSQNVTSSAQYPIAPNPNFLGDWLPGLQAQLNYVARMQPSVITMSMGGNDIGFSDIVLKCINPLSLPDIDCYSGTNERYQLAQEINDKFNTIKTMLKLIKDTTPGNSQIYVVGYPHIAKEDGFCKLNAHLSNTEIKFSTTVINHLNYVIQQAAAATGVRYIDVSNAFQDHMLCDNTYDIAVNGLRWGDEAPFRNIGPFSSGSYHPNNLGHQLLADTILAATDNFTVGNTSSVAVPTPDMLSNTALDMISGYTTNASTLRIGQYAPNILPNTTQYKNQSMSLYFPGMNVGLRPNTDYTVELHSDPTVLGTVTTDAMGNINTALTLPPSTPVGAHTLHIYGTNLASQPIDVYQSVFVAENGVDWNGDGILDVNDPCPGSIASGQDIDHDGLDDACDGNIIQPDITPPTITGTPDRQPNSNGWYNQDVTINWSATDPVPSSGIPTRPPLLIANQEGTAVYQSTPSCDLANNCSTGSLSLRIDKTPPEISYSLSPVSNDKGWSNSDVTITFNCTDDSNISQGGIEICTSPQAIPAGNGTYLVTGTATDKAGNATSVNVFVPIDRTVPTITQITGPATPNANGWYNQDVVVSFACVDSQAANQSGVASCPSPTTLMADGANQLVSGTVTDNAGNSAVSNARYNLDKTPPVISYSFSPEPNTQGWNNGPVTVTFDCSDATSGIDTCTSPVSLTGDGVYIVQGTAKDKAGNEMSVNVTVGIDTTLPTIISTVIPTPNVNGWNNTDVAVSFSCNDILSLIRSCTNSTTSLLITEGTNQTVTATVYDNAGNTQTSMATINIDKTSPTLGVPVWSHNPKPITGGTTLTVPVADNLSGISRAEYFIGDTDPGQGSGATMTVDQSGTLATTFGTDFAAGVYKISVRVKDAAGNWSNSASDYLVVYDPAGPKFTGKRSITPSLVNNDFLPGLMELGQTDKARFGFSVTYNNLGQISNNSDFQFTYSAGVSCNRLAKAQNCHDLSLNSTSIAWMTTQGANRSIGIFQGTGTLVVDHQTSTVQYRVTGIDGERLSPTASDQFQLMIYSQGVDPNTATPIYQVNAANIARGNVKIN